MTSLRYARKLGVIIELGSRVSSIGDEITIVATELESARVLLGDDSLDWPSGRTALLDLGVHVIIAIFSSSVILIRVAG
jgi:hypothetical protein